MKKRKLFLVFLAMISLVAFPKNTFSKTNIEKAKEFMQVDMYPQAIALLDPELNKNPINAEIHFLLAICLIHQDKLNEAEKRFSSAIKLQPNYRYKVGKIYKNVGMDSLDNNNADKARILFHKAVKLDPSLKKVIDQSLFNRWNAHIHQRQYEQADSSIPVDFLALSFRQKICDSYYNIGNAKKGKESFYFYRKAGQYCNAFNQKIGRELLKIAKKFAKTPGAEEKAKEYKEEVSKYIGQSVAQKELPKYVFYKSGVYRFSLKAGEQTGYWITFPKGSYRYSLTSEDDQFKLLYDDGEIAPAWEPGEWPHKTNFSFRIIAVTNQKEIKMKITQE